MTPGIMELAMNAVKVSTRNIEKMERLRLVKRITSFAMCFESATRKGHHRFLGDVLYCKTTKNECKIIYVLVRF